MPSSLSFSTQTGRVGVRLLGGDVPRESHTARAISRLPLWDDVKLVPPSDGVAAGRPGRPHPAHRPRRHRRKHCLPPTGVRGRPVRRQEGGRRNRDLLHLVAGG